MGNFSSRAAITTQPNLTGRVLMVTGANRGIGFETAKQLYRMGGTVYLGVRSEENARRAMELIRADVPSSDGQLKWLPLDLSTVGKTRESAEAFLKAEDRLDVLTANYSVNNACIGDAPFELNDDGIENMMATKWVLGSRIQLKTELTFRSHVGHYVLTTTLLDLMRRTSTEKGSDVRIVNLANLLFTKELQRRLDSEGSSIIAVSVHPGYVATGRFADLKKSVFVLNPFLAAARESTAKMPILGWISEILVKMFFIDEAAGARNSVYAASDPTVRSDSQKHRGSFITPVGKIATPSDLAQNQDLARDLWNLTEKLVYQRMNP
ncbi:short chain dehydrogenase domain-containing protein [Rhizoctonia solani AG-1 IA]|uniref:Short chain dehydrogenase domain-containing protein n=1 Tax=Thanatephorus cucumeris (strain AG1-IA) TaxID=983506 RepID=L8WLA4_THACA|nr:short chain dehydrogenase domain-containing protein [Rhizoctonia solani AG-1 IA]